MNSFARVEAFAPATVANLGIGFDILGLAVDTAGDIVVAERRPELGASIIKIEGDQGRLSHDADKNVVTIVANALLNQVGASFGVNITLKKGLPLASGLGSSAASSVAAAVAVNALLENPLPQPELLPFTLEGEAAVSGYHADNVAPSLLGGITLTNGTELSRIRRLPVPAQLYLALVTPDVEVPTAQARAVLPSTIPLKQMVHQTGYVAELVDAIYRGDVPAMARAMESDLVVEPARAHLMPHLAFVRERAKGAGALALVISGAGPTLCAVCDSEFVAQAVAQVMQQAYNEKGLASIAKHGKVLSQGASIIASQ